MLTREQNELLTKVGPGTPLGELMRRYWVPAVFSWEIAEPDSPPVSFRLLGEDLIAFRDTDGRVGVVDPRCAHRGANLWFGRNEECGIRCVYHGWKFDVDGKCVDMPSEPAASNFKNKVRIKAYPTFEVAGLVFAYMGPEERRPEPPLFRWTQVPPERRAMSKVLEQCNWLQALEGGIDNVHSTFLHSGRPPGQRYDESNPRNRARNFSQAPRLEVVPTAYGYCYGATLDMGDEGTKHVRGYHWIMPFNQIRATADNSGHIWVPIDDENTMVYNWQVQFDDRPREDRRPGALVEEGAPDMRPWFRDSRRHIGSGNEFEVDVDVEHNFRSVRNRDNRYLIDRELQRTQTFTGITGLNTQDRAVQESMGPVFDRTIEHLGTTDMAIIQARRQLLEAIKTVQRGGDPPGLDAASFARLRAFETILPKDVHWFKAMEPTLMGLEETVNA
jgi:phthalate 4,5-dioxygenase oxygenase subunit